MTQRRTAAMAPLLEHDPSLAPEPRAAGGKAASPAAGPLVVALAGMPRSGMSLMASYLHHCGIAMGKRMLGPRFNNPRGHFEDLDFLNLHKAVMKNRSPLANYFDLTVNPAQRAEAERIIRERQQYGQNWGWKDPRTTLFLDLWSSLLPDGKFILLYRDPYENISSEFKITNAYHVYLTPWMVPGAWLRYNTRCIEFYLQNGNRSALVCINGFRSAHQRSRDVLSAWLGLELAKPFTDVFRPAELGQSGQRKRRPLIDLHMKATRAVYGRRLDELYERLDSLALIPSGGPRQ